MDIGYTNKLKNKKTNLYIFTVCNNVDKIIKALNTHFSIKNIPKSDHDILIDWILTEDQMIQTQK